MALVSSPIHFSRGTLGDVSYYKDKKGRCIARMARGPIPDFHTSYAYRRCRLNSADFSSASKLTSRFRHAFRDELPWCSEGSYFNRLMGLIKMIMKTDEVNKFGEKKCTDGNISLLEDFQFNGKRSLADTLDAEYSSVIDAATGQMQLDICSFVPLTALSAPASAKYFQVFIKGAGMGKPDKQNHNRAISSLIPITSKETGTISLSVKVNPEDDLLVLGMGIVFYEEDMGVPMVLRGGAMAIVEVKRTPNEAQAEHQKKAEKLSRKMTGTLQQRIKIYDPFGAHKDPLVAKNIDAKLRKLKQRRWQEKLDKYRKG